MSQRKLIGLHGYARSGKDTLATLIMQQHRFTRMAFADPLKAAASVLFGIHRDVVFGDDKTVVLEPWGITLREALQKLGTEAMRNNFGEDFWIKRWRMEYDRTEGNVVVTDVRFENEAAAIRAAGGRMVHLTRPGAGLKGDAGRHPSEGGVTVMPGDLQIANDSTIQALSAKVLGIVAAA